MEVLGYLLGQKDYCKSKNTPKCPREGSQVAYEGGKGERLKNIWINTS